MRTRAFLALGLPALTGLFQAAFGLAQTERQQRSFPAGSHGATRICAITGDETVRCLLGARAGQRMIVEISTTNSSAYFSITALGATEALHI